MTHTKHKLSCDKCGERFNWELREQSADRLIQLAYDCGWLTLTYRHYCRICRTEFDQLKKETTKE